MANIGYPDTKNKKASPLKSIGLIGAVRDVFTGAKDGAAKASPKPAQKKESKAPRKLGDNPTVTGGSPVSFKDAKKDTKKEKKVNVNRKTKDGGYNSQGVWVKTGYNKEGGGKVTAARSMKNLAHGSEARYKEYEARGWAHDDTTKGYKPKKDKVNNNDSKKKLNTSQENLNTAQKNLDQKKQDVKTARKSTVVKDAIETGKNTRKANRKAKKATKKADKAAKINKRKQKRAAAIEKRGGTKVGAGIRKVGNKIKNVFKKKDKK